MQIPFLQRKRATSIVARVLRQAIMSADDSCTIEGGLHRSDTVRRVLR